MKKHKPLYCKQPDRDCPRTVCGYPLPCPWHTYTIELSTAPTVTVPVTAKKRYVKKLSKIAEALVRH